MDQFKSAHKSSPSATYPVHGANGSGKSMICRAIATALTSEGPLPLQWWKNASSKARVVLEFAHQKLGNLKLDREFSLTQTAHGKKTIFVQNEIRVDGNIRPDISLLSGLVNVSISLKLLRSVCNKFRRSA